MSTVAAVVVTHNRRELLAACIRALHAQERPPDRIYVVDNASTDGTAAWLADAARSPGPPLVVCRLDRNTGGAGGFRAGIAAATESATWLWVMDDDTEPTPSCLRELLEATARHPAHDGPLGLICSRVDWTDGTPHTMNGPGFDLRGPTAQGRLYDLAPRGLLPIRQCTFVSCLIASDAVRACGLPYADYWIWVDDIEYTARICATHRGYLATASRAIHRTPTNHSCLDAAPARFYYAVRNGLWTWRITTALSPWERKVYLLSHALLLWRYAVRRRFAPAALASIIRGLVAAVIRKPRA
jgi:rhamnopyranosyl-N-acetylglucosaminyl-diphospho-decaprenol beta-1,3/1,4-galactofuranosyltransferase